jgi:hypothetical protein
LADEPRTSTMRSRKLPATSDAGRPGLRAVAGFACWDVAPALMKAGAVTIRSLGAARQHAQVVIADRVCRP